ncbi:hypothetical protein C8J55DRAFT_603658 [Lentinula edodes]|uniref:GRIP domain-containing protein n=1 Tax=Lentinula lateritia TaxID=40482 RepID=A0A9W9ART7_9AGAR|nr:hypothetical protein C8J55DRAFT_603658 [Lentinula edodes]
MFSQFRHAVETLAPHPRISTDESPHSDGDSSSSNTRSQSIDLTSPTQLAENALSSLSSLRKSFSPTLPGTPSPPNAKSPSTPRPSTPRPYKSTLEERLRAATAFTIGEASNSTTPQPSARASPAPSIAPRDQPLSPVSPLSTPLPESPISSHPFTESESPQDPLGNLSLDVNSSGRVESLTDVTMSVDPAAGNSEASEKHPGPDPDVTGMTKEISSNTEEHVDGTVEGLAQDEVIAPIELNASKDTKEATDKEAQEEPPISPINKDQALDSENSSSSTSPTLVPSSTTTTVEELQERLKLVEQRFADVSTSFKRLQAEKTAADTVLRELTPLESLRESDALRDYLQNVLLKTELSRDEIRHLNTKLQTQESRIEELRDTHRLESRSQIDQIDNLKKQLEESELLIKASQTNLDELTKLKADNERLNGEVAKGKEVAKDEEEKRMKAISLLKTVRQKLTRAEKDRDDAVKEVSALKEKEKGERAREEAERSKHQSEIDSLNTERDRAITGLRTQFEKELVVVRERHEKEVAALRAELELEIVTVKANFEKELSNKNSRITQLENSLNSVVRDKNSFFEQVQIRQAEVESSQAHLESLQSQNGELQYRLREQNDRIILLNEELLEARREHDTVSSKYSSISTSPEDTAHLLSSVEDKYEAKLTELKRVLKNTEKERNESDAEWSRKLREKNQEMEKLSTRLGTAIQSKAQDHGLVENLKVEISHLQQQIQISQNEVSQVRMQIAQLKENENTFNTRETEMETKIKVLEQKLEEGKSRESQFRSNNKTLREELRKVQSSAALLERQRNPGIGYWTSRSESTAVASSDSVNSSSSTPPVGRTSSDNTRESPVKKEEEEVNLEYLRNVILQFLEHKEMRPNLVRVLSIILHFTPQETRRLVAKV